MPNVAPQRLQSLVQAPELGAMLRAQDKHNSDVTQALNQALVRGDTLQVLTPWTASNPLVVPSDRIQLTPTATWTSSAGLFYRQDSTGQVNLEGTVTGGTPGTQITTGLPTPNVNLGFVVSAATAFGLVIVSSTGVLTHTTGSGSNVILGGSVSYRSGSGAPYVPSCFPFDVAWQQPYPPSLVIAECADVTNQASPSNLAALLTDWVQVNAAGQTLIRVRNIPGLLPSLSYAVTLVVL